MERTGWALLALIWFGGLVLLLRPGPKQLHDFFQDYTSASNLLEGQPIYPRIDKAANAYLGREVQAHILYNAHPPTSILLAVPFARLTYPNAVLAWNFVSLLMLASTVMILARELAPDLRPSMFAAIALGLSVWPPLWDHIVQGQLGICLLLLLTLAWRAARRGQEGRAGALIGVAAAIKLFPALLLVCFLFRKQYRLLISGAAAFLLLCAGTVAAMGLGPYRDYTTVVMPELRAWTYYARNISISGFLERVLPEWAGIARAIATAAVLWVVVRKSMRAGADETFALGTTASLLVAPLTWPHSVVILLLPFALFLKWKRGSWLALLVLLLLSIPQSFLPGFPGYQRAPMSVNLTVLALNFYGLIAFFLWLAAIRSDGSLLSAETKSHAHDGGQRIARRAMNASHDRGGW